MESQLEKGEAGGGSPDGGGQDSNSRPRPLRSASRTAILTISRRTALARLPEEARTRQVGLHPAGAERRRGGFGPARAAPTSITPASRWPRCACLDALSLMVAESGYEYLRPSLKQKVRVIDMFSMLIFLLLVQACGGPRRLADRPPDWPEALSSAAGWRRSARRDGGYGQDGRQHAGQHLPPVYRRPLLPDLGRNYSSWKRRHASSSRSGARRTELQSRWSQ